MATQIRLAQLTGSLGTGAGQVNDQILAAASGSISSSDLSSVLSHMAGAIKRIHGDTSFSEAAAGTFSQDLVPEADGSRNLGSTSAEWAEVHANSLISQAAMAVSASNANLTVKGLALDVDADSTLSLDGAGGINIGTAANVAVDFNSSTFDLDAAGAITIDGSAGLSLDGAADSNFSLSDGDLSLVADGSDNKVVIRGDHESDVAIHLDGNAASASIVDIDAGVLDVDAAGAITMDAGAGMSLDAAGASNLTTSSGALTLDGAGGVSIAGNSSEVDITTSGALDLNSGAMTVSPSTLAMDPSSTFDLDAAGAITIDGASLTVGGDGDTGAIAMDSTAGISLDAAAASNLTTSSGALTVSGAGGLNLAGGGSEIDVTSAGAALDVNVGSVDMDATAGVAIDGADSMNFSMSASDSSNKTLTVAASNSGSGEGRLSLSAGDQVDITDGTASIQLDGGVIDIGADDGSSTAAINVGTNSAARTITVGNAASAEVELNALRLDLNAGSNGVEMDSGAGISLDAAAASNFTTAAGDLSVIASAAKVVLSGSSAADSVHVQSGATFDDNVIVQGDLTVNGTTTTLDTQNLLVEDPLVVLSRNSSGSPSVDSGLVIKRGSSDSMAMFFDESDDTFKVANVGSEDGTTAGNIASVTPTDFMAGKIMVDSSAAHLDVTGGVLTATNDAGIELASGGSGDIVLDSAAAVVIDGSGVQLEFGSADSGEHISGDGTDLSIASGAKINLTATSDVHIPASVGLVLDSDGSEKIESDDTDLTISSGAKINLTATSDVHVPANVGLVFGDGEKIEGDDTDLTISSGAKINLTATSDVHVPANVGLVFGDGEKIEGDDTDLTVSSGAKINLTATSDVVIPANVGLILDGSGDEKIESDGTDISFSVGSGGDINIPANIGLTFGDDGERIEGDGTELNLYSGKNFVFNSSTGKLIPSANGSFGSSGLDLGQQAAGSQQYRSLMNSTEVSTTSDGTSRSAFSTSPSFSVGSGQTISSSTSSLTVGALSTAAAAAMTANSLIKLGDGGSNEARLRIASQPSAGATSVSINLVSWETGGSSASTDDLTDTPEISTFDGALSSSTSTIYITSSWPSSLTDAIVSGVTIVLGDWEGVVGSGGLGSVSGGYRSVAIASASGSANVGNIGSSIYQIYVNTADYAQQRWWRNIYASQAVLGAGSTGSTAMTLSGSIIPSFGSSATAAIYDLGSSDYKFRSVYAGSNGSSALVASGSLSPELDDSFDIGGLGSFSTSPSFAVGSNQSISASGITPSGGSLDEYPANLSVSSLSAAAAAAMTAGAVIKLSGGGNEVKLTIASAPSSGDTAVSISAVELVQGSFPANTSDMYETPQLAKFLEWRNLYVDGVSYLDEVKLDDISEPSDVSNKLYSVSSILHWNGAPLGVPVTYRHVMTASDISSSSRTYTMVSGDRTGDSDVVFSSSTVLNKVQVYLNGQLQYINASGDVNLTSTDLQLDFLASGALVEDDIIQVIVFA